MTVHILVEGSSELVFFNGWLKKFTIDQEIKVHPHQGKGVLPAVNSKANSKLRGLLDLLPLKLSAFAKVLDPSRDGVLILVDADDDDPVDLEEKICQTAKQFAPRLRVAVGVATEEMEAFYLGDLRAVQRAYPHANMEIARQYIPDSICGTWEKFGEVIGDDGGNKVAWAEKMGLYLTTKASQSRSPSFKKVLQKFVLLCEQPMPAPPRRRFYHRAKA